MAAQAVDALGFEPRLIMHSTLEPVVPKRFRPDLLATVREALSNVAKHAKATAATVELLVDGGDLTLTVTDDGIGIADDRARNSGLANLGKRARRWGGSLTVEPGGGGGTRLTWRIPLA